MRFSVLLIIVVQLLLPALSFPQDKDSSDQDYNFHFQQTVIFQTHPAYFAKYSGLNSLNPDNETATSITSTLFFGMKLPYNSELYFNPELSGGTGLSGTTGIAGFPNGEVYRIGNPTPSVIVGRLFLRTSFNLDGKLIKLEDDINQLRKNVNDSRLIITMGKFSLSDIFDDNSFSHDPRAQFFNWSLMSSAAWDYPADTKGYTIGFAAEYVHPTFALRAAATMVARDANGITFDPDIKNAFGLVLEYDKKFTVNDRKGILRFLIYQNRARMGNYSETLNNPAFNMDISKTSMPGRTKTGFAINSELPFSENIGSFLKFSWNDGKNESWMFTEIDRSLSLGIVANNFTLVADSNEIGLAFSINGISEDHKNYLSHGGYGFIIGDGSLNYGLENIIELYFKMTLFGKLVLTPDYQFVLNPAYNKDRGPVHIFALRTHLEL